jgi:hypothetical protein
MLDPPLRRVDLSNYRVTVTTPATARFLQQSFRHIIAITYGWGVNCNDKVSIALTDAKSKIAITPEGHLIGKSFLQLRKSTLRTQEIVKCCRLVLESFTLGFRYSGKQYEQQ